MSEQDVSVKFGADITDAVEGSKRVGEAVEQLRSKVEGIQETFKKIGEIIGVAFTVDAVKEFVASFAELGEQIERTSAILGVSAEQVGILKFEAAATGSSLDSMTQGMARLAMNMDRAQAGSKAEVDAFKAVGISAGELKKLSIDEVLNRIADAYSKTADGAAKMGNSIQLGGRAFYQMIPFLDRGSAGLKELADTARATGDVFSQDMVKGMAETHLKIVTLSATVEGFGGKLFMILKPAIDTVITGITNLLKTADPDVLRAWVGTIADFILSAVENIGIFAINVSQALGLLNGQLSAFLEKVAMVAGAGGVGVLVGGPVGGLIGVLAGLSGAGLKTLIDGWRGVDAAGADTAEHTKENFLNAIEAIRASMKGMLSEKGAAAVGGSEGGGAKSPFPTMADESAAKAAAADLKKSLEEVQKTFEGVFTSIIAGFDRAITGLIKGTMTWKQAMFEVLGSIWTEFAKIVEQMLAKWLASEAMQIVANQAKQSSIVAAEVAGQATAGAVMIGTAIKAILADARETFGGVFAFLSPTMGPLAAGPATAAAAAVAGAASGLPSFAVGNWNVPRDMVAQIHRGEMIVPAQQAEQVRQGGGLSRADIKSLVAEMIPHLRASANASRAMQRNMDSRLRTMRGAT